MKLGLAIVLIVASIVLMAGSIGIIVDIINSKPKSGSSTMDLSIAFYGAAAFGLIMGSILMTLAVFIIKQIGKQRNPR